MSKKIVYLLLYCKLAADEIILWSTKKENKAYIYKWIDCDGQSYQSTINYMCFDITIFKWKIKKLMK